MDEYDKILEAKKFIKKKIDVVPKVGIVLGSGLGKFDENVKNTRRISYPQIPFFNESKVSGHKGELVAGTVSEIEVAVLSGRIHHYEGHDLQSIVRPVRTLGKLGARLLILANASGCINPDFKPGDLMVIRDHINFANLNPLRGENDERLGPRFPDMSAAYNSWHRQKLIEIARKLGIDLKSGVYAMMAGPSYETPAEIRMLKAIGADVVGMSTVPEVIAACHMGIKVIGISCITNLAAGISKHPLSHDEVKEVGERVYGVFSWLITEFLKSLNFSHA
jgi:purine-nucleoside phosphorylase